LANTAVVDPDDRPQRDEDFAGAEQAAIGLPGGGGGEIAGIGLGDLLGVGACRLRDRRAVGLDDGGGGETERARPRVEEVLEKAGIRTDEPRRLRQVVRRQLGLAQQRLALGLAIVLRQRPGLGEE
jgi:hypothetical protein